MPILQPDPRRGPKGGGAQVRSAILGAAAELISEVGVETLSFRKVAARAGVTPAMVPYYFDDRAGLLRALLEEGFQPLLERLEGLTAGGAAIGPEATEDLLCDVLGLIARRSWLPRLMLATVLGGDLLRDEFLTRYAPRLQAAALATTRQAEPKSIRTDLDPRLALISVLAMSVFPFLARPVIESAFGLQLDEAFARDQANHISRLMAPARPL